MICRIKGSLALNMRGYHMEMPLLLTPYFKFPSEAGMQAQMLINIFQSLALLGL